MHYSDDTLTLSDHFGLAASPETSSQSPQDTVEIAQRLATAKIMIIEDNRTSIDEIERQLREFGFEKVRSTYDVERAIEFVRHEHPDLILLKLTRDDWDGLDILRCLRRDPQLDAIPVTIYSTEIDSNTKVTALECGVSGFLSQPLNSGELALSVRNILTAKAYQDHLAFHSSRLEQEVRRRTKALESARRDAEEARQEALLCLARAAEFRDDDTGHHVIRVGRYAAILANHLGWTTARIETLEQAAQLHDVGKIGISDTILLKPARLTEEEHERMKRHCDYGEKIIHPMNDAEWLSYREHPEIGVRLLENSTSPVMKLAAVIAKTHHEKWDGSGYPRGLKGEEIPIEGRITAVADVFDAVASERPYKPAFPIEKCLKIIRDGSGNHFDPQIVDVFFERIEEILQVRKKYGE